MSSANSQGKTLFSRKNEQVGSGTTAGEVIAVGRHRKKCHTARVSVEVAGPVLEQLNVQLDQQAGFLEQRDLNIPRLDGGTKHGRSRRGNSQPSNTITRCTDPPPMVPPGQPSKILTIQR